MAVDSGEGAGNDVVATDVLGTVVEATVVVAAVVVVGGALVVVVWVMGVVGYYKDYKLFI